MSFKGGYRFKHFEGAAEPVLKDFPVPENVYVPDGTDCGLPMKVLVHEGDSVKAGSRILESECDRRCAVMAPVNGRVTSIDQQRIEITSDGSDSAEPVNLPTDAPWDLPLNELFDVMCASGCWILFDRQVTSPGECVSVKHVIINAAHTGPLDQAWSPELFGEPSLASDGIRILEAFFPGAELTIAVNRRSKLFFASLDSSSRTQVRTLSDKYPQDHPELLARDVTGKRLLSPEGIRDHSLVILPYEHVIQIAEVLIRRRPLIDRIIMIAGPGVTHPGWYRVRIGAAFEEIRRRLIKSEAHESWRIVRGNLLTGEGIPSGKASVQFADREISVIRESMVRELWRFMRPGFKYDSYPKVMAASVLPIFKKQLDSNVHGGLRPCVQCNFCDEVCPVAIYPFLIWKYVEDKRTEESFRFRPYNCIGCGLCNYVCPSKIPLASSVISAINAYRELRRADEVSG